MLAKASQVSDKTWKEKGQILKTWPHLKQVEGQGRNPREGALKPGLIACLSVQPTPGSLIHPLEATPNIFHTVKSEGPAQEVFPLSQPLEQTFCFVNKAIQRSCFQQARRMRADGWAWFCLIHEAFLKTLAIYLGLFQIIRKQLLIIYEPKTGHR